MTGPGEAGRPADHGAQNERTALAWHRTAMSVVVAGAAVARLTFDAVGGLAYVMLGGTILAAMWLVMAVRGRYARRIGWSAREAVVPRDGRPEFVVLVTVMLLAAVEVVALLR